MELFHGKIQFFPANSNAPYALECGNPALKDSLFARGKYCKNNFNNFASSFIVLMELTVVNQWHDILFCSGMYKWELGDPCFPSPLSPTLSFVLNVPVHSLSFQNGGMFPAQDLLFPYSWMLLLGSSIWSLPQHYFRARSSPLTILPLIPFILFANGFANVTAQPAKLYFIAFHIVMVIIIVK